MSEPVRPLNVWCPDCRRGTCKEDMYGTLPRDLPALNEQIAEFDEEAFLSHIHGLLIEHPIIKFSEERGSAVACKIAEAIWDWDDIHPRSYLARCFGALIEAVAYAAVERIVNSGLISGCKEEAEDQLHSVLRERLWTRSCDECGAAIPIRHCWCAACRIKVTSESSPPPPELVQP